MKGEENLIKRSIPSIIQVKLMEELQRQSRGNVSAVCKLIKDLGYHLYRLSETSEKFMPIPIGPQPNGNVFCVHENREDEFEGFVI